MTDEPSYISSSDNSKIKTLKKLQRKKYRDQLGTFVVENPLTIRDGLKHGAVPQEIYATEDFLEKNNELLEQVSEIARFVVDEKILQTASTLDHPQGIIATYAIEQHQIDMKQSVIFLAGVSDPGNVGTIIRSAAAFGVRQVVLDTDSADFYNPKTISAAKEAIFLVIGARQEAKFIGELHKHMSLIGLDMGGKQAVSEVEWSHPVGIVLGSEAHGIPEELRGHIDTFVHIPMDEGSVESLNVGASAAITLFQFFLKK